MQFLAEEFFRKVFKMIDGLGWGWKIGLRLFFYVLMTLIVLAVIWLIYTKNYAWIVVIAGLWILAELAHKIRKNREKKMVEIITKKHADEKDIKITTKKQKSVNKDLLGLEKTKNKELLKG